MPFHFRLNSMFLRSPVFIVTLFFLVVLPLAGLPDSGWAEGSDSKQARMPERHLELFEQHCLDCHDAASREAGVDLESISYEVSRNIETAELWQKVLNAINSGEMPPKDSEPLEHKVKADFLRDLTAQMVMARKILGDTGGQIPLRRLNRREYAHTIETLLGVAPDVSSLPSDQTGAGYDTQGGSLYFSSNQLEQYLASATQSLKLCLTPPKASEPKTWHVEPEDEYTPHYRAELERFRDTGRRALAWQSQEQKPPSAFGILDPYQAKKAIQQMRSWTPQLEQYLSWPETRTGASLIMTIKSGGKTRIKFPSLPSRAPGKYLIRVRAGHYPDAEPRFHYLEVSSGYSESREHLGWRRVTGTLESPEIVEFEVTQRPGEQLVLAIHQRSHQDRGDKNLWTRDQKANGVGTPPGVWVDWAEVIGPVADVRPGEAANRILFERPVGWSDDRYASEVIRRFAEQAFRGQAPEEAFLTRLNGHYRSSRASGQSLRDSLISPLAIVLASPQFLYMVEPESEDDSKTLNLNELAVRLSYFLWSGPPDEALMRVAADGSLADPAILKDQTVRLLEDPRSERFVRDFTHQWLEMDRLGMFQFNGIQFPSFDNAVRENAREEIFQSVQFILRERLPMKNLLDSEFVVINDVMADFYGIPGVIGHQFRKVDVPEGSPRGGLITTAAVLAMGSDGLRSSPVERGAWVLRHLLNDPPAPAPPNVPQLSRFSGETLSARELQRAHQEQPQCYQCHQKIDPIGFALEHFSADGLWRDKEVIANGRPKSGKSFEFDIDPSGQLPDGEVFADHQELRRAIASHDGAFAQGFAENLISYGLGRPYGFSDQRLLESLMDSASKDQYDMTRFIHALVQSSAFQSR